MKKILLFCSSVFLSIGTVHPEILTISNAQEYARLIAEKQFVVVEFYANWCTVCKSIKQPFADIANDPAYAAITFAVFNVDSCEDFCKQQGIKGIPTFFFIKDGKKIDEQAGVQNIEEFKEKFKETLQAISHRKQSPPEKKQADTAFLEYLNSAFSSFFALLKNIIQSIITTITGWFK